jgi:hypothetical protein
MTKNNFTKIAPGNYVLYECDKCGALLFEDSIQLHIDFHHELTYKEDLND